VNKLYQRLKAHYSNKSKLYIISDILFYLLLLLLLIPSTRTPIVAFIKKATLTAPLRIKTPENSKLSDSDYRWTIRSAGNTEVSLEQFKGNVIFLNFWATWCPPCIAEMPSIQSLYEDYGDKMVFLLVSREDTNDTGNFVREKGYSFPVFTQLTTEPERFSSQSIPTSFLISPDGEIILKKKGAAKWDSKKVRGLIDSYLE